jgi:hypothetical protein
MKRLLAIALSATLLAACGGDDDDGGPTAPTLDSANAINAYLAGKSWLMTGADIPSHPNGFDEDVNYGPYTQCYMETVIQTATNWVVNSKLGTLGGSGCDHATQNGTASFTSNTVLVENVQGNGECFDITVTYTGFGQEGRGKFDAAGTTMTLELFFTGQATGHRCADGAVGAATVTLNAAAFTGNAQQIYRLQ